MSEPSKWALKARQNLARCGLAFFSPVEQDTMVIEIQQAIDAALAERDKRISELEAQQKGYCGCRCQECGRSPAEDSTVALTRTNPKGELGKWICWSCKDPLNIVTELRERLSSLQALMEQMPHQTIFFDWSKLQITPCYKDCPRCAYEKWLKESSQ